MVLGLVLGKLAPKLGHLFEPLIPLGLFLMIYPTVVKVPFEALRRASGEGKPIALTLLLNYLINPLLLYVFGWIFLHRHPELWVGLILLGIAPCIDMVLVWADLSGTDNPLSVSLRFGTASSKFSPCLSGFTCSPEQKFPSPPNWSCKALSSTSFCP